MVRNTVTRILSVSCHVQKIQHSNRLSLINFYRELKIEHLIVSLIASLCQFVGLAHMAGWAAEKCIELWCNAFNIQFQIFQDFFMKGIWWKVFLPPPFPPLSINLILSASLSVPPFLHPLPSLREALSLPLVSPPPPSPSTFPLFLPPSLPPLLPSPPLPPSLPPSLPTYLPTYLPPSLPSLPKS